LYISIAKFHIFNDGNKRSAILSGALFLSLNNCDKSMNLFIRGMEVPIIEAVTNHITKDELKNIIEVILSDSQY
jgi:death-on-curing protein